MSSLTWHKHHWGWHLHMIELLHDAPHVLLSLWDFDHLIGIELVIRWWRFGIEHPKSFSVQGIIPPLLMCGQSVAFSLKWWTRRRFFLATLRSMSCLRFSGLIYKCWFKVQFSLLHVACLRFSSTNAEFWALQLKKHGQALLRCPITSQLSQSGHLW